jgi:hypothetical protein
MLQFEKFLIDPDCRLAIPNCCALGIEELEPVMEGRSTKSRRGARDGKPRRRNRLAPTFRPKTWGKPIRDRIAVTLLPVLRR